MVVTCCLPCKKHLSWRLLPRTLRWKAPPSFGTLALEPVGLRLACKKSDPTSGIFFAWNCRHPIHMELCKDEKLWVLMLIFWGQDKKSSDQPHNSGFAGKFCCHLPCGKATPARQGLRLAAISPSVSAFDSRNTGRLSLVQRHIGLLVGGWPTPLKNMTSSVGMMTFPTEWKNKIHVPNHQPDI